MNDLELKAICVRLPKKLIADMKRIAKDEGLTYQQLIRHVLTNKVSEIKNEQNSSV